MIFDLHNLVPSVGQVNALRNNSRYGIIPGENRSLGSCDVEWNSEITEPKPAIRGNLARVWLYMADEHNVELMEGEKAMFLKWSQLDRPSEWEFERNKLIKNVQGNGNPYVESFFGND
jgi:deoxyribonuclease-1